MAKQTNMDIRNNPSATVPIMEFMVPVSEFDMDIKKGQRGRLDIPVEIVDVSDGMVTFRKTDSISAPGTFHDETVNEMRSRLQKDEKIQDEDAAGE